MKLFQHATSTTQRLIEVDWNESSGNWTVWARRSEGHDWDSFVGPEAELDKLWSLARDLVTGG